MVMPVVMAVVMSVVMPGGDGRGPAADVVSDGRHAHG
jgi:hypothetical protein